MREVLLERDFPCVGTATVTLNRADRGNALTSASLSTLLRLLEELQNDKTVFAVVLTGAGKYFCTGMDLSGSSLGADATENAFLRISSFPKPLIARVNGPCLGGGVGLLFCCDLRIAQTGSFIQFSEVLRGLVPALISAVIVPQLGVYKSREYMMTGKRVTMEQLLLDGQISSVEPNVVALDAAVLAASKSFLLAAPGAVALVKKAVSEVHCAPAEKRQKYVLELFKHMMASPEAAHGMGAFMAKKDPDWPMFVKSKL